MQWTALLFWRRKDINAPTTSTPQGVPRVGSLNGHCSTQAVEHTRHSKTQNRRSTKRPRSLQQGSHRVPKAADSPEGFRAWRSTHAQLQCSALRMACPRPQRMIPRPLTPLLRRDPSSCTPLLPPYCRWAEERGARADRRAGANVARRGCGRIERRHRDCCSSARRRGMPVAVLDGAACTRRRARWGGRGSALAGAKLLKSYAAAAGWSKNSEGSCRARALGCRDADRWDPSRRPARSRTTHAGSPGANPSSPFCRDSSPHGLSIYI